MLVALIGVGIGFASSVPAGAQAPTATTGPARTTPRPTPAAAPAPKPATAPARTPARTPAKRPAPKASGTGTAPSTTAPATTTTTVDPESLPIPEGNGGPVSVGGGMAGSFMRLMFGLAIVVALIFGVWHLLKRVQRGRYPALAQSDDGLVGVLATTPLGPNRALHIVRIGTTVVLVGATDHAIQTVTTLDAATAAALIAAHDRPDRPTGPRPGSGSGGGSLLDRIRQYTVRG